MTKKERKHWFRCCGLGLINLFKDIHLRTRHPHNILQVGKKTLLPTGQNIHVARKTSNVCLSPIHTSWHPLTKILARSFWCHNTFFTIRIRKVEQGDLLPQTNIVCVQCIFFASFYLQFTVTNVSISSFCRVLLAIQMYVPLSLLWLLSMWSTLIERISCPSFFHTTDGTGKPFAWHVKLIGFPSVTVVFLVNGWIVTGTKNKNVCVYNINMSQVQ